MAPPAKKIEQALLDGTYEVYSEAPDDTTVNKVRKHVEEKLSLKDGFFTTGNWKAKSKTLIKDRVDQLVDGWVPETKEESDSNAGTKRRSSASTASKPKRQKRAPKPKKLAKKVESDLSELSELSELSDEEKPQPKKKATATSKAKKVDSDEEDDMAKSEDPAPDAKPEPDVEDVEEEDKTQGGRMTKVNRLLPKRKRLLWSG
ncbi:hypothetical protein AUP68_16428 [Ilyonectria robusta]